MNSWVLQKLGYKVVAATSSLEALALFREKPDEFDLVITDMTIPDMMGDKLAAELITLKPTIPVILFTGYSNKITEETASEIGIKAFAYKPVTNTDLAHLVRRVLDKAKSDKEG